MITVVCHKLQNDAILPAKGTPLSAGYDLFLPKNVQLTIPTGVTRVGLGFALAIPFGYYGRVAGRSGLAYRGIKIHPGTVDQDYTGELFVLVHNDTGKEFSIAGNYAIAQIFFERLEIVQMRFAEVKEVLEETERGNGSLGSTDKFMNFRAFDPDNGTPM